MSEELKKEEPIKYYKINRKVFWGAIPTIVIISLWFGNRYFEMQWFQDRNGLIKEVDKCQDNMKDSINGYKSTLSFMSKYKDEYRDSMDRLIAVVEIENAAKNKQSASAIAKVVAKNRPKLLHHD